MSNPLLASMFMIACSLPSPCGAASSQHGHTTTPIATASEHDAGEAKFTPPTSYAEAVAVIAARTDAIGNLIKRNQLSQLHSEAAVIKQAADGMPRLVAKESSGVPLSARPEVLKAAMGCSDMFPAIDDAGDAGNAAASAKAHADLAQQVAILQKYAPAPAVAAAYACPMHLDVTSAQPGKCTKCGMSLVARTSAERK